MESSHPIDTIYTPERFNNDFESEVHYLDVQTRVFWPAERKAILSLVEKRSSDMQILDIGCGSGAFLNLLLYEYPNITASGIDINDRFVQTTITKNQNFVQAGRLSVHLRSVYDTKFADNSFDMICIRFVFQHLLEPDAALNEIMRILKPGGRLLIATMSDFTDNLQPNIPEINLLWKLLWLDQAKNATQQSVGDNPVSLVSGAILCEAVLLERKFSSICVHEIAIDSFDTNIVPYLPLMHPKQFQHLVHKKIADKDLYDRAVSKFEDAYLKYQSDPAAMRWVGYETLVCGIAPSKQLNPLI